MSSGGIVRNTTFSHNSPNAIVRVSGDLVIYNSILWNIGVGEIQDYGGATSLEVYFSNIDGGWGGAGSNNINADPLFADPNGPDDIDGNEDDDLILSSGSPCIDAADNDEVPIDIFTDLDDRLRFVDDLLTADTGNGGPPTVDMGAYEFACTGNLDDISSVTLPDFAVLAQDWLCTSDCTGDVDGDGDSDIHDLASIAANWLCGTVP